MVLRTDTQNTLQGIQNGTITPDKDNFRATNQPVMTKPLITPITNVPTGYTPAPITNGYKPSTNLQSFTSLLGFKDPAEITQYFGATNIKDIDDNLNTLSDLSLSNAGFYTKYQEGLVEVGSDKAGNKVYSSPEMLQEPANYKLGESQLSSIGTILDSVGAFTDKNDANNFARFTKMSSDPRLMGDVAAKVASGDTAGAVNSIIGGLGVGTLADLTKDKTNKDGMATAFSAYNLVGNWDTLNTGQRAMALSGLAMKSYKFATGEDLSSKVLIPASKPGAPSLTVGNVLSFAGTGLAVNDLMKNWGQLDGLQRLTYGMGTASQIATTARQLGLIGPAANNGAAIPGASAAQLGAAGFTSVPSGGVGAISGPGNAIPQGYSVIQQLPNGQVIAVPGDTVSSTAPANGAGGMSIIGTLQGAATAGLGAMQVYKGWGKGGTEGAANGAVGGTQLAAGIQRLGESNPYVLGGIVALSVLGNTVKGGSAASKGIGAGLAGVTAYGAYQGISSGAVGGTSLGGVAAGVGAAVSAGMILKGDGTDAQKATALRRTGEDAAAAYFTVGISSLAQMADKQFFGGKLDKLRTKIDKINPLTGVVDKIGTKAMGAIGSSKSLEQIGRDKVRGFLRDGGVVDEKFQISLADGSSVNLEIDGHGGMHEFARPDTIPEGAGDPGEPLRAYQVDWTNDLDYTANLATTGLMRLVAGAKGENIDSMGQQLANASLGNIGFKQDMTPENFDKMQANVRGFFAKSGIKSKEDAIALANQGFGEQRFNEMDLATTLQGINIAFDDSKNAYQVAQQLMAGRTKGISVAADMPSSPGPNLQAAPSGVRPIMYDAATGKPVAPTGAPLIWDAANNKPVAPVTSEDVQFGWAADPYLTVPGQGNYMSSLNDMNNLVLKTDEAEASGVDLRNMSKAQIKEYNFVRFGQGAAA